jgi:2-oxoglutarate ferredoxin oxidoreductase subunit alpha
VEEMFYLTIHAFNLAEQYRTPVILLADEIVAHMREQIHIPPAESIDIVNRRKPKTQEERFFGGEEVPPMPSIGEGHNVAITGSTHDEFGRRFTADPGVHQNLVTRLVGKIRNNAELVMDFEAYNATDCEIGFITYGCTSRAAYEAIEMARNNGINAGLIRLKTLWPFPERIVQSMARNAKKIIVPEMNVQQLFFEVERATKGATEVIPVNKIGGGEMLTPEELYSQLKGSEN